MLTVFQCITMEGWTTVMYYVRTAALFSSSSHNFIKHSCINVRFTPPARHDKTVLSVSCRAVWIESRDRLVAKSEQLADRSPSSRGVQWRSIGLVICNSPQRVYILRRGQRRCLRAVAEAVDRQARQSCLVLSGVAVWVDRRTRAFCAGVRPAVALRRLTHSNTDQTQNAPAWLSGRLSSHRHTTHDKTVLSVSCLAWRCKLRAFRRPAAVSFYPRSATLVRY